MIDAGISDDVRREELYEQELERAIREIGRIPHRRTTLYDVPERE